MPWNILRQIWCCHSGHDALSSQGRNDVATVSICKKCIYPKPARTHHCSICNRLVLALFFMNPSSDSFAVALGQNLT